MSEKELKFSLHTLIEATLDRKILQKWLEMMKKDFGKDKDNVVIYTVDGQSLTQKQLEKRVLAAIARVKAGQFTSQEELNKEVENW